MSLQHYTGPLGTFDYDPEQFTVTTWGGNRLEVMRLKYIGHETMGEVIKIPIGSDGLQRHV